MSESPAASSARARVSHSEGDASYLLPLLPLRGVRLGFSITRATHPRFFHQPAVAALVRTLMDGALADEPRIWIDAPDTGRSAFGRGDPYAFHVWCCAGAESLLETLIHRLRRLPRGAPAAQGLVFGDNLRFHYAADCVSSERYQSVAHLRGYGPEELAAELDFYLDNPPALLRFLSPARLVRPKGPGRPNKGEGRYVHDRSELAGPLLAERIDDSLAALLGSVGAPVPARGAARFQVTDDDIGWYDLNYGACDDNNPMGGIIGAVTLDIADPVALPALVLGQYTGIGQRRTFGWGRYRLETATGQGTLPPRRPHRSVLQRAADPGNLELAYRSITASQKGRRDPDAHRDPFEDDLAHLAMVEHPEHVDRLLDDVRRRLRVAAGLPAKPPAHRLPGGGTGQAAAADPKPSDETDAAAEPAPTHGPPCPSAEPLYGCILQREGKAPRPLAVPDIPERIAQRAVHQVLRADLDALLSAAAYGYRRGISRADARDRLQALYRQGYDWLYEADIDDFFDTVSHQRLETRLRSLLPDDPVVDQLLAWMAAPVSYRGHLIERPAGLPQGSPLSPLLANLMLDDFDADLEHLGFKLVRFADDFVIACRSREEAEAAAERVRRSLAEVDLALNADKSGVTHFDRGFRFLGYTFLRDLAVDSARAPRRAHGALRFEDLPPASWLARLARRVPAVLDDTPDDPQPAGPNAKGSSTPPQPETRTHGPPDHAAPRHQQLTTADTVSRSADEPCTLLVVSENSRINVERGRLRIVTADGQVHAQPLSDLASVLLLGRQRITSPTLSTALEAGVPIHFATRGGRYQGVLTPNRPGPLGTGLWLRQTSACEDPAWTLPLARDLVAARIHNQSRIISDRARGRAPDSPEAAILGAALDQLRKMAGSVPTARDRSTLNGIEGSAARAFFQGVAATLPPEYSFAGRKRRPPPDPLNAMLSLGYTLLYQRTDSILRAAGLLPEQGLYHQTHGRHAALASDLMECFRHLVERQAISMLNRGELKPDVFEWQDGQGCRLKRDALRRYLGALSARFLAPVQDAVTGIRGNHHQHLWRMARDLIAHIDGRGDGFTAFRTR